MKKLLSFLLLLPSLVTLAQTDSAKVQPQKHWYEKMSIRGYMQIRYNRLLETNSQLKCEQCDKSWGENNGFFIRRGRIIFSGQIHERVFFYVQPDFGSAPSSTVQNYLQLRDAYLDIGIDKLNEFRFRVGLSKLPYGFDNMQSSSMRATLDRSDAINSALVNERDLGVMFYWAPAEIRKRFASLVNDGLKGSGDFGVIGLGVFNGQTANLPERNNELHVVARASYPIKIGKQIIEPGIQAYKGKYVIVPELISVGTKYLASRNYDDERVAASFVLYPQPFGIQAEYNIGKGPEFNPATDSIEVQNLTGGYVTLLYSFKYKKHQFYPFFRMQYYDGGKKHELDARSYTVNESEIGIEWQPIKAVELTAQYTISKRRFEDFKTKGNTQEGSLLRLQLQLNF